MSATTTFAPSRAKSDAAARPMPDPEPVMNATLPSGLPMWRFYQVVGRRGKRRGSSGVLRASASALRKSIEARMEVPGRAMKYEEYQHLLFERREDGVLLITINRPDVLNATNARLHWELSRVWKDVDDDPETNVVVVTGKGRAFSAGGDLGMIETMKGNHAQISQAFREAGDIVYNMINCEKPIISAINGVAVGAGLAVALLADITIASESMRITDGHLRLGVAAGDHAVIIWPLLCGMAKAKYYLLTADFIDGKEAERIGLVSICVPADQLMAKAMEVAQKL